jgi:hypothetical protein
MPEFAEAFSCKMGDRMVGPVPRLVKIVLRNEDVFNAVFEWLAQPDAAEHFQKRQKEIIEDLD